VTQGAPSLSITIALSDVLRGTKTPLLVRGNQVSETGDWAPCHRGYGERACDE